LNREGRPEDPEFQPAEKLFRRFQRRHLAGGEFSGVGLSFKKGDTPDAPSVNREKYSEARDVLLPEEERTFVGWGVLSWRVQQIPTSLPLNRPEFTIRPKHKPLDDNYAHSEIHCARLNTDELCEPNKEVRKLLRTTLGQRANIEIEAES
jgi:hypothetical protein